jgi:DNA polymerase-1
MPPILYLIDGHALAYRTYFAITGGTSQRLQTHAGEPTAGILGFANVLMRLIEQDRPEYLAVAFDTGKTFRDEVYPAYKSTRAKMPEDLRPQIDRIRQLVDAFHFPRLEKEGFEADDVLGSIARQAAVKGLGVKIITGDRDLLQLVDERTIVNLAGSKLSEAKDYTAKDVVDYLGVTPKQIIEYKGLVGDSSDNIPGVKGVGEKTAVELLSKYPTLEEIYAHLDELKPAVKAKLEASRDTAFMSRDLATIRTDLALTLTLEEARTDHINISAVEALFHELEFTTLLKRLQSFARATQPDYAQAPETISVPSGAGAGAQLSLFGEAVTRVGTPAKYELSTVVVDTPQALAQLVGRLAKADWIGLDTETTSTDPMRADLVGISLAVEEGEGYYVPVGHHSAEKQLPLKQVIETLRPVLESDGRLILGHNLKYDALSLMQNGLEPRRLAFDTMIAEFLIDPGSHRLGLKDMADGYLDAAMTHIEELIGTGKSQVSMAEVPVAQAAPYAAADAEVALRLKPILEKKMAEANATRVFEEIEMPLVPVLARMEQAGVALDVPFLQNMSAELSQRLVELEKSVIQDVGYPFNLNSTQQLSKVLFETLKLEPPDRSKKTASGHYSTSADVLELLKGQHQVVDKILEYRELSKLKSTYTDALPLQLNPRTGRVHTSYNQTGSVTGRLASSDPNLQNIPTRTELGRQVRQAFIAGPGKLLLSVDYSQIELRIVAHMSGDEAMLSAFRNGLDIHAATAAAVLGKKLSEVTHDQRRNAKAVNFGLIYGMSAFGLSRNTGLTLGESEQFVKAYFQQFPGVKSYLDGMRKLAAQQGYVETLLGRRRYFPNLKNPVNFTLKAREEREAINAPIQGTAADIMKIAMVRLPPVLKEEKLSANLLLQVHDELVLELPESELKKAARIVRQVMESAYTLSIPLLTEAKSGTHWGNLQPISSL